MHQIKLILFAIAPILLFSCSSTADKITDPINKKAELHYNQGTKNLVAAEYTNALDHLIKANNLKPNDSEILNNLGMAYFFKKQNPLAKKYLKKAIAAKASNSDAKNNLASIYFKERAFDKAAKIYKEVLKDLVYRHQYRVYYNLALISLENRNTQEALNRLDKAITENDAYCPAHFLKGKLTLKKSHFMQAYENFLKASKGVCYKNPEPIYYQGVALKLAMRYELALIKFENIVSRFPSSKYYTLANTEIREIKKNYNIDKKLSLKEKFKMRYKNNDEDFLKRKELIDFRENKPKKFNSPEF